MITLVSVIGTLLIAGISLYLNYRSRSSPHREFLYQKQIEGYNEVLRATAAVSQPCLDFLESHGFRLTPVARAELRSMCDKLWRNNILEAESGGMTMLPASVLSEVDNLYYVLWSITAPNEQKHLWPRKYVYHEDPFRLVNLAQQRVYSAIRKAAGIGPLSRDILRVVGKEPAF